MGSHFTNDDLMRETSYLDDYDAVLSTEDRDGRDLSEGHPDAEAGRSRGLFASWSSSSPPTTGFRSEPSITTTGSWFGPWTFDQIQTIAGKQIPMRMTIVPVDAPEERTVVEYLELKLDVPVDDQLFTRQGLRRAARG